MILAHTHMHILLCQSTHSPTQEVIYLNDALRKILHVRTPADLALIRQSLDEFINLFFGNPDHDVLRSKFRGSVNAVREAVASSKLQSPFEDKMVCPLSYFKKKHSFL